MSGLSTGVDYGDAVRYFPRVGQYRIYSRKYPSDTTTIHVVAP